MLSPGVPALSAHTSSPFRGQQLTSSCASRQVPTTLHCPAGTRHLPSQPCPHCLPPPTQFSKKQCVWSRWQPAGPEAQRTDSSQTQPSGLLSVGSI